MFTVGLDIGYSNLKVAMGSGEDGMSTRVLPAGAGSIDLMPRGVGSVLASDFIQVVLPDGSRWAAGVEPDRLQGWERELHQDYKSTQPYLALFYAALLMTERTTVDLLVTGLPVSQAVDEKQRSELASLLKGEHQIAPKRRVEVKEVMVVPQPVGAYMDLVQSTQSEDMIGAIQEGRTVVIDPGFYSVDWVTLAEGEVHYRSSGSSLKAMSRLLQVANDLIHADHGGAPGVEKIEKALRSSKSSLYLFGQQLDLSEYIDKASKSVSREALTSMRKTMRDDGMNVDVVLVTGGGASNYIEAATELFPKSKIVQSEASVLSNARGFWYCGQ